MTKNKTKSMMLPAKQNSDLSKTTEKLPPIKARKLSLWFQLFTDETNPKTFLNRTESAKQSKYNANSNNAFGSIGMQNYKKLTPYIDKWMDDHGLSEDRLKSKLLQLIEARETKLFTKRNEDGQLDIIEHEIPALETQHRSLDMALKVKGMYHTPDTGSPTVVINFAQTVERISAALRAEIVAREPPKTLEVVEE